MEDAFEKPTEITTAPKVDVATINLSSEQLEKISGHFWNDDENYARKIYVKNDTLRYFRGEGNESALAPIASNAFKMLGIDVDLKVMFSESNKKRIMTVIINDDDPVISEEFTPPNYKVSDLKEFVGAYFSPELNTTYEAVLKDDKLTFRHARLSDFQISGAKTDLFLYSGNSFLFKRDDTNQITGFRVSSGRVQNLWFKKLK